MSELGSISGKIQREDELLKKLNDALLILEVDALGRNAEFDLSVGEIAISRNIIKDFVNRLLSALKQHSSPLDLRPVIHHFRSGMKPINDWIEDLEKLNQQILSNRKITDDSISILEDILSLLDDQFTEDLRHLYSQ